MNIAVDAMGGDHAPEVVLQGAASARLVLPAEVQLTLVGDLDRMTAGLQNIGANPTDYHLVHAPEVIEMGEHPTKAIAQKPHSSIAIGFHLLKEGKAQAFCGAGNTGAMMVGAMFSVKAIEGVIRPCIVGYIPKESGKFGVIVDVGANAECRPEMLVQFAQMGSQYAESVLGYAKPKVGLMNLGEEPEKGTTTLQQAHQLIKALPINFVGNVEGRDLFNDAADVIVCDGFVGNVMLKLSETFYTLVSKRGASNPFFDMFNYESVGGSPILGVNAPVIIGHGSSNATAIHNMILQGHQMVQHDLTQKIKLIYQA
jgi:glycerol-3-phosphate acyltransferase PlsX